MATGSVKLGSGAAWPKEARENIREKDAFNSTILINFFLFFDAIFDL
jgi:hypothetical protein